MSDKKFVTISTPELGTVTWELSENLEKFLEKEGEYGISAEEIFKNRLGMFCHMLKAAYLGHFFRKPQLLKELDLFMASFLEYLKNETAQKPPE